VAVFTHEIPHGSLNPETWIGGGGRIRLWTDSDSGFSVVGLRARYNERGDFLITSTPALADDASPTSGPAIFPQFVQGVVYTTEFILLNRTIGAIANGSVRYFSQSGQPVSIPMQWLFIKSPSFAQKRTASSLIKEMSGTCQRRAAFPRSDSAPSRLGLASRQQCVCTYTGSQRCFMRERGLTIPEIMLIGGTRVALGAGIGLLVADRLNDDQRKGAGWALLAVGALTTIPILISLLDKPQVSGKLTA